MVRNRLPALAALLLVPALAQVTWTRLSSSKGELPDPGGSNQQTGVLVANLDKAPGDDFVISHRVKAPALVWFRHTAQGWNRSVIDPDFLTVEAGGAAFDIDGDGDLDIVFGADWQGNQMWWWENPYPELRS